MGEAAGFTIHKSNNAPTPTADHRVVIAGVPAAITFAEQVVRTEAFRSQTRFADAVRGLYVYGAKLIRPDAIATVVVDPTA